MYMIVSKHDNEKVLTKISNLIDDTFSFALKTEESIEGINTYREKDATVKKFWFYSSAKRFIKNNKLKNVEVIFV